MQTFLPYRNFYTSLHCLDTKRLGKQRLETFQILDILINGKNNNYKLHPAVRMWAGFENVLKIYFNVNIYIWKDRGYKNNYEIFEDIDENLNNYNMPDWWSDDKLFHSHRANLLRKKYSFYNGYLWGKYPIDFPYYWPVSTSKEEWCNGNWDYKLQELLKNGDIITIN